MIDYQTASQRMQSSLDVLQKELAALRSGRANPKMLDPVMVETYGNRVPLQQCASVSVPEPRQLAISVWDPTNVKAVEKAISDAGLGLNPQTEGTTIRLRIPELNEERRMELIKLGHKYAETAKVAVRNLRRDHLEFIKKNEKDKKIGEDDARQQAEVAQKLTDKFIAEIDKMMADKEKDIKHI
ncbi:MAG: ribosome recycling factor [Hydrotalea sp.]|nr:ribosome recycling factor [Hydrotalea sp.]